jgi:uncharacterized membrane protein
MYLAMKLVHVVAVIMFLGNITTGVFWKAHGDRTRDPRVIAAIMDGIIRSDRWFTMPGVLLIIIAGFGAAGIGRISVLRTPWILWSIILFSVSGLAFVIRLVPLQRQMRDLARSATDATSFDWTEYQRLSGHWNTWGGIALVAPLIAAALMVLKP